VGFGANSQYALHENHKLHIAIFVLGKFLMPGLSQVREGRSPS
jgi:hypothetical protein